MREHEDMFLLALIVTGVVLIALLLSAAGLYALMAVAVTRRLREIGIRLALGATSFGVLRALFARVAAQLGVGIILGNVLIAAIVFIVTDSASDNLAVMRDALALPMAVISVVMVAVGLMACAVPARRALRVHPTSSIPPGNVAERITAETQRALRQDVFLFFDDRILHPRSVTSATLR